MVKTALALAEPPEEDAWSRWIAELSSPEDEPVDINDETSLQQAVEWAETVIRLAQQSALTLLDMVGQFRQARTTGEHQIAQLEEMLARAETITGQAA